MSQANEMVKLAITALEDKKGEDIRVIDIREVSVLADYFLIASGSNGNQVQAMADNGMTVPGANKAALEAVTTGEVGILVAGVDYNAYSSKNKGEPLDIYYPAGGTIVNPRPAMILKTAPNMDNAKAFVDYLFSDEAQQLVANAYLLPGRTDIKCDKRSNLEDIPQITPDWDKMMAEASDDAAKINQICGASNG